ncbi:MAG: nucleotide-binding protein [Myxococcaceae bacterium]
MRLAPFLLIPLFAFSCTKNQDSHATSPAAPAAPALAAPGPSNAPAGAVKGKVLESIDAASYSYLRLQTAEGEAWAAVPKTDTKVGAEVTIANPMAMNGFESKTLGRKFEKIYFGTLGGEAAPAAPLPPAMPPPGGTPPPGMAADVQHGPTATPPPDLGPIKVAKAEGAEGRTIAELFAQKAALKDKPVAFRGKVVKFTSGVMSRNWLHLRDGSGTDEAKNNDITVTTTDTAAVGDVVLVKGTVHLEKDFGAGYSYAVIVEDAKLSK